MNDGLERMSKKAVLVCSDVLFRHLPVGMKRNHEACVRVVSVAAFILANLISSLVLVGHGCRTALMGSYFFCCFFLISIFAFIFASVCVHLPDVCFYSNGSLLLILSHILRFISSLDRIDNSSI